MLGFAFGYVDEGYQFAETSPNGGGGRFLDISINNVFPPTCLELESL